MQNITGSTATNSFFGISVTINSAGNTIVVGADGENSYTGAVYIFTLVATTWTFQQRVSPSTPVTAMNFGYSVQLNATGSVLVIGAYGENTNTGAIYIYTLTVTGVPTLQTRFTGSVATYSSFGHAVAINGQGNIALGGAFGENSDTGAVYIYS